MDDLIVASVQGEALEKRVFNPFLVRHTRRNIQFKYIPPLAVSNYSNSFCLQSCTRSDVEKTREFKNGFVQK